MSAFERLPPPDPAGWHALLGRKISIRYALDGDPQHPFSEAIGVVARVSGGREDQTIAILGRSGEEKIVRCDRVLAGKVFP